VAAFVTPTAYTVTGGATYAPNIPAGLTSGTVMSSSLTWTWTASVVDSTHGAAVSYVVETSPDNSTWSAAVAVSSGTSYTWTGLTASTTYYLRVAGVNTVGTTAYSSSVEGTTSASSGAGYSLTYTGTGGGNIPTSGATYAHGAGGIIAQINDNSSSGDGSHTVPSGVVFAWGSSNTVAPTTGLQTASQYSNGGHNMWVVYLNAPATAGSYYLWAIGYSSGSTVAATYVWPESMPIT
jgi:cellulose 1,4-beta-cellobiosidase